MSTEEIGVIYGPADTILRTRDRYTVRYQISVLPCSGEKHAKLFRRALLEVNEDSRLLAPTASSHCEYSQYVGILPCCGYCAARASRISNLSISGSTLIILPMLAVYFAVVRLLFCIADRYQVPGIMYQVFDTARHTRRISGYILRILCVVMIE